MDATSGKLLYSKNLINSNFEENINENQKENNDLKKKNKVSEQAIENTSEEKQDAETDNSEEDEEFLSLTSIEDIIKPSVDKAFKRIKQIKKSFLRINTAKFDFAISGKEVKESIKKKEVELIKELTEIFDNIILNNNAIEFLVDFVYGKNKKVLNIETSFLKLARKKNVDDTLFKKLFLGREIEKNWFRKVSYVKDKKWKNFLSSDKDSIKDIVKKLNDVSQEMGIPVSEIKIIADRI